MQLTITFRNLEAIDSLKSYAREAVERVSRFLDREGEAHVVLSVERHLHVVDITMRSGPWTFRGHDKSEDMYVSIDEAMDHVERQFLKTKDRVKQHHGREMVHHRHEMLQPL